MGTLLTPILAAIGNPFIPGWSELRPFVADLWLIVTILAVLITPFFASKKSNTACALVAMIGLIVALISLIVVGVGEGVVGQHFRGMLVIDPFAILWKAILIIFVIGVILMWFSTTAATMHEGDGPEFFTLLIGATLGMSLMASTTNLLMIFMVVEMASLPSYVLAGFRKTDRIGAEASLKYVLFGAATSAIMVYGLSFMYGLYGTLQVEDLAASMSQSSGGSALLVVALFGLIVGLGFKISAVPFHFWCPDVFEGASIDVSAFLSVASKGAGLALLLRVLMTIAESLGYQSAPGISLGALATVVGVIGAITATVGNTAAYFQNNIKRLLAYSSIGHAGYMMCALSLLVKLNEGFDPASMVSQAILIYLAVYLFMNLGAFTVAGLIARQTGREDLDGYAGLSKRSPVLAACMTACMFSLVGLPPFAGFIAKVFVMYVLGLNGGVWWWLVGVIGVNTIISLYFYMRVVKVMYLRDSSEPAFTANPLGTAVAVASALALVLMFVVFYPLQELTAKYSKLYVEPGVKQAAQAKANPTPPVQP